MFKEDLSQTQTHPRCKYSKIDFGTNTKLCVPNPENTDDYFDIQNWVECHNLTNKPGECTSNPHCYLVYENEEYYSRESYTFTTEQTKQIAK